VLLVTDGDRPTRTKGGGGGVIKNVERAEEGARGQKWSQKKLKNLGHVLVFDGHEIRSWLLALIALLHNTSNARVVSAYFRPTARVTRPAPHGALQQGGGDGRG
jgi:hypothetical protein